VRAAVRLAFRAHICRLVPASDVKEVRQFR
jgi:hypothetical protein